MNLGQGLDETPTRSAQAAASRSDSYHRVGIHKHTFGVVCECPAVELSEGHSQVGSLHHGKVRCVATVQHVHQPDLIVQCLKHCPAKDDISTIAFSYSLEGKVNKYTDLYLKDPELILK